jgi:hypothetical protein
LLNATALAVINVHNIQSLKDLLDAPFATEQILLATFDASL